ncbi:Spt20 family-domain-containing protein [Amylocystis lapponica]|nr:Spt20 family-domain-containing protein [Amylocystis lapponica]
MAGYNLTRTIEELLRQHEHSPPSFTVRLYPDYWTLNNGSKFLYNNQIASLLDDIRAQRIPVDFLELFDEAKLPFYDGCMIVELLDYRPVKVSDPMLEVPDKTRVVLTPNGETLWADICLLNKKAGGTWSDRDAMEVEARLLLATTPPLCLDPNPHLTRMVNSTLRISVLPLLYLQRKAAVMVLEEERQRRHGGRRSCST